MPEEKREDRDRERENAEHHGEVVDEKMRVWPGHRRCVVSGGELAQQLSAKTYGGPGEIAVRAAVNGRSAKANPRNAGVIYRCVQS